MSSTSLLSEEATVNNNQNLKISRGKYKKGSFSVCINYIPNVSLANNDCKRKDGLFRKDQGK